MTDPDLEKVELYAWVGRDELAPDETGEIGIKQGLVPAGMIPLVSINKTKVMPEYLLKALQEQANRYGKTIRLCRFVMAEEVLTLEPKA